MDIYLIEIYLNREFTNTFLQVNGHVRGTVIRRVHFLAACCVQALEHRLKNATFSIVLSTAIGAHGYHGEFVLIHVMGESDTARGHVTIQLGSKYQNR